MSKRKKQLAVTRLEIINCKAEYADIKKKLKDSKDTSSEKNEHIESKYRIFCNLLSLYRKHNELFSELDCSEFCKKKKNLISGKIYKFNEATGSQLRISNFSTASALVEEYVSSGYACHKTNQYQKRVLKITEEAFKLQNELLSAQKEKKDAVRYDLFVYLAIIACFVAGISLI